jgi:hypothetical protein
MNLFSPFRPYGPLKAKIERYRAVAPAPGARTRVYVVQQPILRVPGLWHYAVLADAPRGTRRRTHVADHGPVRGNLANDIWENEFVLHKMPPTSKTVDEIADFSDALPSAYWLFLRDCRHHTSDVLDFIYGVETKNVVKPSASPAVWRLWRL